MPIRSCSPRLFACAVALTAATSASAAESFIVGPRALGMGGTGVACVNDVQAQYYNPAAFGFFSYGEAPAKDVSHRPVDNQNLYEKDWGFAVDVNAGLRVHDRFAEYADDLKNIYDSNLIQNIENGTTTNITTADMQKLTTFASALEGIDNPDEFATADLNAGFGLRIVHFGIGVRAYGEAIARVTNLDMSNFGGGAADINTALNSTTTSGSGGVLTAAQQTALTNAGISGANVTKLDQLASSAGLSSSDVQSLVDLIAASGSGTGTVTDNTTTVLVRGVAIGEIPISYGYAINDHVSIGGSLKFIKGRLYGTAVRVFDDNAADTLRNARDHYQDTATGSIDLGVMTRWEMFQAGITGRNLTRPKFKGFDSTTTLSNGTTVTEHIDDYTLDPSAAVGVAFIPAPWFTLAADADLTRNKTIYPDYKTQHVGLGAEVNAFYFLALRGGVMKNIAESDVGLIYTAGLGLNLWAMRLDVAAAMAKEKTTFDGREIPREMRGSAQLAVDF
jgi:hypothetical protein